MNLTEFGVAVRKARLEAKVSLQGMAKDLDVSPAYLSSLEVGRKKVPGEWVKKIETYFYAKRVRVPNLAKLADVSNKTVSLEGMNAQQAMMLAGFARTSLTRGQMQQLAKLLKQFEEE